MLHGKMTAEILNSEEVIRNEMDYEEEVGKGEDDKGITTRGKSRRKVLSMDSWCRTMAMVCQ